MRSDPGPLSAKRSPSRALAPVGAVLLVALVVVLAGGVAATTWGMGTSGTLTEPAPTASLSLSAEGDRLTLTHRGGEPIQVAELTIRVVVDGEPLARQPPVPFFSATGFRPGPTGPFNPASDDVWVAGESASLRVASTNDPSLAAGRLVEVRLAVGGRSVATLETRVAPDR